MQMDKSEIADLLEEAAQNANHWHAIGTFLQKQDLKNTDHPLWIFVYAFEYMYVEKSNDDYRARYGPFAPLIETVSGAFPPPLTIISEESLSTWAEVLNLSKHPAVRSRLADLLWVRKWGQRPDLLAKVAIEAYMQVPKGQWDEIERALGLIRAFELSREVKNADRKNKVIELIINEVKQELSLTEGRPGISLRFIEALMDLPPAEIPEDVHKLLELAREVYSSDVSTVESVLELMIKLADPYRKNELRKEQINRWLEEAERSRVEGQGLVYLAHLQHALELARNFGFKETAEEILLKIQAIPEKELGLSAITAEVRIPKEKVENFLNWFVDAKGWPESLTRFGFYGPPSGDYEQNLEEVKQRSPLKFLMTNLVLDESNAPILIGRDYEENVEIEVVRQETLGIRIFGNLATDILQRIVNKHGMPEVENLSQFFTTELIPPEIAENIAQGVNWYFKGEYDVAAHLLVPRIEAVFRNIARILGLAIIHEPVGATPGGVVQLGKLLAQLKGRMDESWRRYFYNLLVNPISVNLRNRICHGLLQKTTKEDSALLIHLACHLTLLQTEKKESKGQPDHV